MSRGPQPETEEHFAPSDDDVRPLCASVFVDGQSFVVELPTRGSVVLGRDPDSDVQLGIGSVSRQHARLDMRGDNGKVVDLGARNGTFLNGERISDAPERVERGDEIWLGSARLGLIGGALVPSGVRPVLVRSALFARLDAELARGAELHALALRLPGSWYAHADVVAWLPTLPATVLIGMVSQDVLVLASEDPLARMPPPGDVGRARGGREMTGAQLVTEAVRALQSRRVAPSEPPRAPVFVAVSMVRVQEEVSRIAPSTVNVLFIGETGVGKEVFARMLHERSGRTGHLVSVNSAAIPEALVESELFGHERGAFPGAHQSKVGLIESAHGGTLFLDEIGELSLGMQAKLLRVLEQRFVRPIGAAQEKKVDVRFVAASQSDLERSVEEGTFRADLLFRLNACTVHIPPLRERVDEILLLAEDFLARVARDTGSAVTLAPETADVLRAYRWPGNVRELRNVIERGVALAGEAAVLLPVHLPAQVRSSAAPPESDSSSGSIPPGAAGDVRDALKDYERQRILDALDKTGGNRTEAAKALGLPRRTLTYKMAKLGIGRD